MSKEFRLPELGENITSGSVAKVLVAPGDVIAAGQNVLEIETDKAVAEIPCAIAGKVVEVQVQEGQKINVGDVILILDEQAATAEPPVAEKPKAKSEAPPPREKSAPAAEVSPPRPAPSIARQGPARAAPSVRQLAREHDVNLNEVPSSDPGGKITAQDVLAFVAAQSARQTTSQDVDNARTMARGSSGAAEADKWGPVDVEPMNAIRNKAAEHLTQCWNTIPHVTHFDKADITELEAFRLRYAAKAEKAGARLTITAFLLKALPEALKRFPRFNASVDMDKRTIILKRYYHLGLAVDTPNGLVVPVLRDVDQKNVLEISLETAALAERARDRKLTLEELQGGAFTVSNLGGLGGYAFTPIINAPEVAILGVSRSQTEAVYVDGDLKPRLMLPLSLSYDHRVIDGADAARFLRFVAESLEQPWRLMLGL